MAGRDAEFADYFTARFDAARRTAFALCGDWGEAEELAQSAFVKVYARWRRIREETVDAYLRKVLTHEFLNTRRRRRARERAVAEPPERVDARAAGSFHAAETRGPLLAALARLPDRQRAVVVLRFVQDLSIEQVAEAMGCSTGTVKSQASRGLAALREAYSALGGEATRTAR
ncbi:RNA polymerase sigma-70 factor, sigma-E family [Streptoalloteichus tenebrarius]|uniref:RNA polymerase sigma factor n=1 Tax=Streptoalloteichus tenebrarius (strain ATCC 17920 / DSM 40477 / JCM 4838 / CBS 697.72 / NBRC 16177 / NCIMB 11028 / NRRL B-12390 / A12253. 1 / ISP 5477) TaxID=1933 RepID=A0ABT1HYD8_STRSD|nr:SigE family RNA polymerase sigma factor [Streptoalloteichus tenebrarius]MCP2260534.1 RNA polymerase sigma-70 factor, sigma-E family [Streptoalloteichus tenebrarius]BFF01874.1 SigE family RNA polymerase sigma factor [Streptoalloteichus tenebrarius]